jgi:FAD:protein FMN transferase
MRAANFAALGTYVSLIARDPDRLAEVAGTATDVLGALDRTCSRFRDDSDLSRANRRPGSWVDVDPMLVAATEIACDAARQTAGLVNPLLGRELALLGYDRDFELLTDLEDLAFAEPDVPDCQAWQAIELDPDGRIRVPTGTALDLGATAKAWGADLIAEAVAAQNISAVISLGGDVAIADSDVDAQASWPIEIAPRFGERAECSITLGGGGLATSGPAARRWRRRGVWLHHLIDPRTGLPTRTRWRMVTATGPSATAANIASTAAIVLGDEAASWLDQRQVTARLVDDEGTVVTTGGWPPVELLLEGSQ